MKSPFIAGPVVEPNKLLGRKTQRDQIRAAVKRGQSVQLLGERRMGKTSLLRWVERFAPRWQDRSVVSVNAHVGQSPEDLVLAIAEKRGQSAVTKETLEKFSVQGALKDLLPLLLLVDEASALVESEHRLNGRFLDTLREFCQSSELVWISAASRNLEDLIEKAGLKSKFLNDSKKVWVGELEDKAVQQLVGRLDNREAAEWAQKQAGRLAFGLQLFCDMVWQSPPDINYEAISYDFADEMQRGFKKWWEARSEDEKKLLRKCASGVSPHALSDLHRRRARSMQRLGLVTMDDDRFLLPGEAWSNFVLKESSSTRSSCSSRDPQAELTDIPLGDSTVIPQAPPAAARRRPIDVGIIVALREEFRELHRQLPSPALKKDGDTGAYDYIFEWAIAGGRPYGCAATFVGSMGPKDAALATDRFINRRDPTTIVMLGIAAGIDADVQLGDVVVANHVNQYLDQAKVVPGLDSTFELEAGGAPYRCSDDLVRAAQELEFAHADQHRQWQEDGERELQESVGRGNLEKLLRKSWLREQPQFISGPIASGPVVGAAQQFTDWLEKINRKFLALEMESGGMLAAIASRSDPARSLILRGISDFGDKRKQKLDRIGKGAIRRYAMNNAIRLLWKLIEAEVLLR
ncbi:MAG: AAA family ATPase [bacterium]|nr:AAA family ATPase [bacterium]